MSNFSYTSYEFNDTIKEIQKKLADEIRDDDPRFKQITKDDWEHLDAIFWRFRRQMPWHSAACSGIKRVLTHNPLIPTACVGWINGSLAMGINIDWFFSKPLIGQLFVLAHETEHVVRSHLRTIENWPTLQKKLNFTMDVLINTSLVESGSFTWDEAPKDIISYDVFMETIKNRQPSNATLRGKVFPSAGETPKELIHNFTAEELLKYLPKEQDEKPDNHKNDDGSSLWSIDEYMDKLGQEFFDDGKVPGDLQDAITESIIDEANKSAGTTPGHLKKYCDELKDKTNRDWRKALRGVGQSTKTATQRSWGRINKRLPWFKPGKYIFTRPAVLLVIDRSGSVGARETKEFIKECNGLVDWVDLDLIFVDAAWDPTNPDTFRKGVKSIEDVWSNWVDMGGGTDFNDVYKFLQGPGKNKYETVMFLTDGFLFDDPLIPGSFARYNVAILTPHHCPNYANLAKSLGWEIVVIDDARRNKRKKIKEDLNV